MNLQQYISDFAAIHDCITGITDAAPLPYSSGFVPFVNSDIRKRTDPTAILPHAKSIIMLGMPYAVIPDNGPVPDNAGLIAAFASGEDYHTRLRSLLKSLVVALSEHYAFKYKILVDSPFLDERALAVRGRLGFYGRNGLVIAKNIGSRFNIGCLVTDIPYEINATPLPIPNACPEDCHRCIKACPTGAITEKGVSHCISYLTQKSTLSPAETQLLGRHLYGCDICQAVCPHNGDWPTPWAYPENWLTMTDDALKSTYSHTPMLWQGLDILRRNAAIVANNLRYNQ